MSVVALSRRGTNLITTIADEVMEIPGMERCGDLHEFLGIPGTDVTLIIVKYIPTLALIFCFDCGAIM